MTSYTFAGQTIGYWYYPSGKLAKLIYPGGSENGVGHVEYTYNADGRLYQVIDKLDSTSSPRTTAYAWYTDGRLQSISRPNGTTRTISYETATGRPSGIAESAGLNWTIGYWSSDDIKTLDLTPAIAANQLSAVPNASMTFDSANQLATFNGQTVTHDLDGNMLTGPKPDGGMALYSYDSRNRLTGMGTTAYTYNAENNRIGIISPTETTTLVVDPEGALPKVLSRTKNGVTTRYVYGAGLQYEVSSAGVATYYHFDQTGNTAALSNQAGSIIERVAYSPYGVIRYRQSNFDTPFLYGGFFGVTTDGNGLINMRARYYNPATMRFINVDPARSNLNWYAYASGNPVSLSDPTGLASWQPDAIYQHQIRGNTEVMQLLQDRKAYIEDVSIANNIDSDIVRAIILHESRGFGDRFERLEAQVSWIRRGTAGSYGYAQLGPDARRASNLSIEQAQTMSGSINGAAKWVSVSQTDLISKGVSNPSVSQVASQYNYARQDGLVSNYGRQVNWTYNQIQSGSTGGFHQASPPPRK